MTPGPDTLGSLSDMPFVLSMLRTIWTSCNEMGERGLSGLQKCKLQPQPLYFKSLSLPFIPTTHGQEGMVALTFSCTGSMPRQGCEAENPEEKGVVKEGMASSESLSLPPEGLTSPLCPACGIDCRFGDRLLDVCECGSS